ncbi:MAG: hypothetical protein KKH68_00675 [Proteobacteria bacterium]|nr:hypothetical protein [Pseudomonadota bacterium]
MAEGFAEEEKERRDLEKKMQGDMGVRNRDSKTCHTLMKTTCVEDEFSYDISKVFVAEDIFIFWMDISGI